mgnify:CR=1 FL=1
MFLGQIIHEKYEKSFLDICNRGMKFWEDKAEKYDIENKDDHLRFIKDFDAPYSNNLAEQALSLLKTRKNVSKMFGSASGAQDFVNHQSVIITTQSNRNYSVLSVLKHLINPQKVGFPGQPEAID